MKNLKLTLFAAVGALMLSTAVQAQEAAKPATEVKEQKPTGLSFKEDSFNFGDIEKGKPATHEFTFKNTSDQTILITNVKASCGCTTPSWTKTPIKPGESGNVTATYNAAHPGAFTKTVTVTTNDTDQNKILSIKGKVVGEETPAAAPATSGNVAAAPVKVQAAPAKAAAPGVQMHTVAEGETLSLIAKKYYGDIYKYDVIYNANKAEIPASKVIRTGQVIKIPSAK